jgi:hypothetical protein
MVRLYAAIRLSPRDIEEPLGDCRRAHRQPVPTLNTEMCDNKGLLVVIKRDKVKKKVT